MKGGRGHDYDHGYDLRLHPAGDGFVAPKAKRPGWLRRDPAPWRGITVCPAQGSPAGLGGGWPISNIFATHNLPVSSSDILQKAAASPARGRSSRTTLY
ncbi:MAG TPA: hypothetical protein VJ860_13275 [Polyangia bacterium]|jgi:hypothetical protein|nr:hypothetical protein [Polyangia bacterium]